MQSRYTVHTVTRPNIPWSGFFATPGHRSSTRGHARCTRSCRASTRSAIARTGPSRSRCRLTSRIDESPRNLRLRLDFAGAPEQLRRRSRAAAAPPSCRLRRPIALLGRDRVPVEQPDRADSARHDHPLRRPGPRRGGGERSQIDRHGDGDRVAAIASIAAVLLTTMLATVALVPDRVVPVESQFRSVRPMLVATFVVPLRHRAFLWLMASRLLIFMGFGGLQNFAYFYFDNVFFHHDAKATAIAASTLLGLSIAVAALVPWPASRLSERTGRRPLIFAAGLFGAVGTLVLVFSHYQWLPDSVVAPLARFLKVPDLAAQATLTGLVIVVVLGLVV